MDGLSPRLKAYLRSWYSTSTVNQAMKGVIVDLTFEQFVQLFEKRQLASLERAITEHRLEGQQHEDSPYAYVLTWRSYSACSTGIMSRETACVCSRLKSARINLPKAGDRLRASHRRAIGDARRGKPISSGHKRAISEASKGRPKQPWSEERKAARRELLARKKAARV